MGDVIQLRQRPVTGTGEIGDPIPAPSAEKPSTDAHVAPAVTIPRRGSLDTSGVRRRARLAASRLAFEATHTPHRAWRLIRYFVRGVVGRRDPDAGQWVGGWLALLSWCFAANERRDAHQQAADKPGAELRGTRQADHIAVWHSAVLVIPHIVGAVALDHVGLPAWLVLAPLAIGTAIYGWRIEPKPPAPIEAPRVAGNLTTDALNEALRAVGILTKPTVQTPHPDGVRLARIPRTVGGGQEAVIDLPASIKASAADVIKERERIAASLAVPVQQLIIEPGEHAGRVVLWCADRDPFASDPTPSPLLNAAHWSIFDRVPFGHDPRGDVVAAPLFETSWLVGGLPGSGKTTAARAVAAAAVLDPEVSLYVFDGKGGSDWSAIEPAAVVYDAGPIRAQAAHLRSLLESLLADGDDRFHRMRQMPPDRCPDNKLTPELATGGMPFVLLVIDEFHRHLADEQHGAAITTLLIDYVKGYRAAGYGLLAVTQDAESGIADRFTSLRRIVGTRWCGRVMDWAASNMILGDQMNTRGYDASLILPSQRGTGILRTDLEADTGGTRLARTVRAYHMDAAEWAAVCRVGANLRSSTPAAKAEQSDELLSATELLSRFRALAPDVLPRGVTTAKGLGEHLWSCGLRAEGQNAAGQRVRSRLRVEAAVGLPEGALRVTDESPTSDPAATASDPTRSPFSNPTTSKE